MGKSQYKMLVNKTLDLGETLWIFYAFFFSSKRMTCVTFWGKIFSMCVGGLTKWE